MGVGTDPTEKGNQAEEPGEHSGGQMSFLDHLEELRSRLIKILAAVGLTFAACWTFAADSLFNIAKAPIQTAIGPNEKLTLTSVTEPFNLQIKVAFVAALFLAAPFIMAQIWLFIAPGLYKHERKYASPFIISSTILFVLGGIFGYYVAFPFALQYLVSLGTSDMGLKALITAGDYFDLFVTVEVGLGIVFEIPALIFILSRIGLVSAGFLFRNTKYAILIAFILAAVLTPTGDIPNMMILAVPMIALYALGIVIAYVFAKKKPAEA